jgi:hypothetical protein
MKRYLILAMLVSAMRASASPPASEQQPAATPVAATAEAIVQQELLKPLAKKEAERSRFSRAPLPARLLRARMVDAQAQTDKAGRAFLAFAVDACYGGGRQCTWRLDSMTGCVYPQTGEVFVKRGDVYLPGTLLLGKKAQAAAGHVCRATTNDLASAR